MERRVNAPAGSLFLAPETASACRCQSQIPNKQEATKTVLHDITSKCSSCPSQCFSQHFYFKVCGVYTPTHWLNFITTSYYTSKLLAKPRDAKANQYSHYLPPLISVACVGPAILEAVMVQLCGWKQSARTAKDERWMSEERKKKREREKKG
ncbi:hypothetical protein WMY93_031318 [Mugilogobius chulae]|uniref:Uncharacterized protein n=1 Tax=Mugilogobius chulae TaxID=88201 RepID=A0AAW0MGB5_9GOBI